MSPILFHCFFWLMAFFCSFDMTQATLMGQGLGPYIYAQESKKPWEKQHASPWLENERHATINNVVTSSIFEQNDVHKIKGNDHRPKPCVGLCYYEKLIQLQGKKRLETSPNDTDQKKAEKVEPKQQPCVGICQYYRSLGLDDSSLHEKRLKKKAQ